MKRKKKNKKIIFVCGIVVTAIGFVVVPPIIRKCSSKMMKRNGKIEDIDFDNLGPEVVEKREPSKEE